MHDAPHVRNPVCPAILVPSHRSHTALKFVADRAMCKNQVLPFCRWPELFRLVKCNLVPVHGTLLQRKIERGILVRRETHARHGLSSVTDGPDLHSVLSGLQFFYLVSALAVGQSHARHLGLRILSLDKCGLKRCSIRALHRSCDRCAMTD